MKLNSAAYASELTELIQKLQQISILRNKLFLLFVVAPTLLSVIYFGLIASDIYVSESRFIVRSPSKDAISSMGGGFSGVIGKMGLNNSENDSYTAENYIQSRDALGVLNEKIKLKEAYSESAIDRLHRFAGIRFWDNSLERFYEYYLSDIIGINHDESSGITTLTVRAFNPNLAYVINEQLNELSEVLINHLNLRARQDMLEFAQKEVELARNKVENINQKMYQFRNLKQSGSSEQQVAIFQQLGSEKDFADRNLAAAFASLEQARIEAIKKQLYLERVANPSKPDSALEPKRIRGIITTFILGLVLWGIASMIIAGAKEHQHHA
jgi:capsular polysaccharide transport system permease protein